jgi:cytochrome b561
MTTPPAPASAAAAAGTRYTGPAIGLHWVMALLIAGAFCVGLYMEDLPLSPTKLKLFNYHKWTGITILALAALRLLWRLIHNPPALPPMPAWQSRAAHIGHGALYLLFFAVPLAGWAYSSASGFPVVVFGVLPLPDFVSPDRELAKALVEVHGNLAWLLAIIVGVHVAAVAKHSFIDRDDLLSRMRPGRT